MAGACYGGLAGAGLLRSLLNLRRACAERGVPLQIDLGGGEALMSRARAGMLARFLQSTATHLLFVDSGSAFEPAGILQAAAAGGDLTDLGAGMLLIGRAAARSVSEAHPELTAGLGDVRNSSTVRAAMVFESVIELANGDYLADLAAFAHRWRDLGAPP